MERFISILIIDQDVKIRQGLKEILLGSGNNPRLCATVDDALPIIERQEIGIILINIDDYNNQLDIIKTLKARSSIDTTYIILISKDGQAVKLIKGMKSGAIDYIEFPFNPNLIKSKIEVYKSLYFKDQRIGQLLENIFPDTVLNELANGGKFTPKRVEKGIVMFTDFVNFSPKAKDEAPLKLIKRLEKYFNKFDEIIKKYKLEKIKTIGDSYMALAGVTEGEPEPAVRACLAAMEIQKYMRTHREVAKALKRDFWEIRIGIHEGPLVAGIIGNQKYSFDVWGDTVNIASRAEHSSEPGQTTITNTIYKSIKHYFHTTSRGRIDLLKRGGSVEMYFLNNLKSKHCLSDNLDYPNSELRALCGLTTMDFSLMRIQILNRLKSLLPEKIIYHDLPHSLNVEKAVIRFGKLEGINDEELLLLRTASLFHDSGFIVKYHDNENEGMDIARSTLPKYGYTPEQIDIISKIIESTKFEVPPRTLLEKIMCDADHDYLGRADYKQISRKLREELKMNGDVFSEKEWIEFQLNYLEKIHTYYTDSAINLRKIGKENRILELKKTLNELSNSN